MWPGHVFVRWTDPFKYSVFLTFRALSKVICYAVLSDMTQVDGQTHTLRGRYLRNMLSTSLLINWRQASGFLSQSCLPSSRAIWSGSVSPQCDIGHNWPWEGETHAGPRMTLSRPALLWSFQIFLCLRSMPRPLKALCFASSLVFSAHTMHYLIYEL